jgi:hypothetical protein
VGWAPATSVVAEAYPPGTEGAAGIVVAVVADVVSQAHEVVVVVVSGEECGWIDSDALRVEEWAEAGWVDSGALREEEWEEVVDDAAGELGDAVSM